MNHYLYKIIAGEYEGEEFIVNADNLEAAAETAHYVADKLKFICRLTDYEAEMSGLDIY